MTYEEEKRLKEKLKCLQDGLGRLTTRAQYALDKMGSDAASIILRELIEDVDKLNRDPLGEKSG